VADSGEAICLAGLFSTVLRGTPLIYDVIAIPVQMQYDFLAYERTYNRITNDLVPP
jgi:hypothetical protein